jgi:hypothetical protein
MSTKVRIYRMWQAMGDLIFPINNIIAEMPRSGSKLGKTHNSIHPDSRDSCHRVSLTLG